MMLDQNTIIEIVNEALPIVVSSPIAVKLISVIENVVKTLYAPVLTFKNGKAEVDVEMYKKQKENELLSNQTFTVYEITKLKNFISVAEFAYDELDNSNDCCYTDKSIDFDWIMRFFEAVSNISNEKLQKLWGKVLTGEIKQPGICSLRTLDIIRNMSQEEARIYNQICEYVLNSGNCYFIFSSGFSDFSETNKHTHKYISDAGLNYSDHIIPMIECGLLSTVNNLATNFKTKNILSISNEEILCLIIADETKNNFMEVEAYFLTASGIELYNIIKSTTGFTIDIDYATLCFRELKTTYPNLLITAYKIVGEDDIDSTDLL